MMVELEEVKECLRSYGSRFWQRETVKVLIEDLEEQLGRRRAIQTANDGERPKG